MALVQGIGDEVFYVLFLIGLLLVFVYYLVKPKERRAEERVISDADNAEDCLPSETLTRDGHPPSFSRVVPNGEDALNHERNARRRRNLSREVTQDVNQSSEPNANIWDAARRNAELNSDQSPRACSNRDTSERGSSNVDRNQDDTSERTTVCITLIHLEQRRQVICSLDHTFNDIAREHFHNELASGRRIRFVHRGQIIPFNRTLREEGIANEGVVHVAISNVQVLPEEVDEAILDISHLFPFLLGIILLIMWTLLVTKPFLFTFVTKLMLYFISFGYLLLLYGQILRRHFVQT